MKCLVTGATGFIGRHLMSQLLAICAVSDIVCVVEPKQRPRQEIAATALRAAGVHLYEADLSGPVPGKPPLQRFDVIFHLAANVDTAARGTALDVNDRGTKHLLDWLGESCCGARVVYASSIAVHDRIGTSRGAPISETSPLTPRTGYGQTKLRGERIVQAEAATRGYTYTILRLATVFGSSPKPGGLFDTFTRYAARGALAGRLNWPGRTSVIHAEDAAELMIEMAQRPDTANEVYCVANPDASTVAELASEIGRATEHPVKHIRLPSWVWWTARTVACSAVVYAITPRPARLKLWRLSLIVDDGFWFDTSKLQAVANRAPRPLVEGLRRMFDRTPGAPV